MQNKLYFSIKKHFSEACINYVEKGPKLDIYIPEINLGIVFDRAGNPGDSKIQILSIVNSQRDIGEIYPKLYYEDGNFDLLWNSFVLYITYHFDEILWDKKIFIV